MSEGRLCIRHHHLSGGCFAFATCEYHTGATCPCQSVCVQLSGWSCSWSCGSPAYRGIRWIRCDSWRLLLCGSQEPSAHSAVRCRWARLPSAVESSAGRQRSRQGSQAPALGSLQSHCARARKPSTRPSGEYSGLLSDDSDSVKETERDSQFRYSIQNNFVLLLLLASLCIPMSIFLCRHLQTLLMPALLLHMQRRNIWTPLNVLRQSTRPLGHSRRHSVWHQRHRRSTVTLTMDNIIHNLLAKDANTIKNNSISKHIVCFQIFLNLPDYYLMESSENLEMQILSLRHFRFIYNSFSI